MNKTPSIVEQRLLFEGTAEPGPGHNLALPNLAACPDGSILLAHRAGTRKNSGDGAQRLWRSRDDGATWQSEPFPFRRTPSGREAQFRTSAMSRIGPNRLALLLTWLDHPPGDSQLVNPATEGLLPVHIGWGFSDDSGITWSELREIDPAPLVQACGNGPMAADRSGRLFVAFETYKHWDDSSPWSARSAFTASDDGGRSWQPARIVAGDPTHFRHYWDQHLHVLRDGTLIDVMWRDDRRQVGRSEICFARSPDGGRSWSEAASTGIAGQFSTMIERSDGSFVMVYVRRGGEPSIRLRLLEPGLRSWGERDHFILYGQSHDDVARFESASFTQYLTGMVDWSFGWPTLLELPGGDLLVGYYVGASERSSIHLARVRLD